jgi:hypothetical protein
MEGDLRLLVEVLALHGWRCVRSRALRNDEKSVADGPVPRSTTAHRSRLAT